MKKKIRPFLIPLSLIVLLFLLGLFFSLGYRRRSLQQLEQLEDRIQRMEQLVSVRQIYREVIYSEKKKVIADRRVLFSLDFFVEAGVKLDNCRIEEKSGGEVVLYLPPVEILSIDSDETSIKEYFVKEQFSSIRFSDYLSIIEEEKKRIILEASTSAIESRARANGENTLRGIFQMAGIEDVTIRYSESLGLGALHG